MTRPITDGEARDIGWVIGDFMVAMGHPLTCNGGNPNFSTHHDHEVRMLISDDERTLVCPECGRVQQLQGAQGDDDQPAEPGVPGRW